MAISAISSSTADPYAVVRAANAERAAANAAARQVHQATENKVTALTAQAQSNATADRQATAVRQQASTVQSAASVLNVYA